MEGPKEEFLKYIEIRNRTKLLRISTAGSVDDGKSTFIGRLLHDTKNLHDDTLASLVESSAAGEVDFSLVTDGLKAEREQKITIDVAYRYFSTANRSFILADTPGHEQYTRNMATGASTSDVAIILVNAKNGITTQTKRHSFILSLLGVKNIVLAVNKMDLVNYSEAAFKNIIEEFQIFKVKLGFADIKFIPICALKGDNLVNASKSMEWYQGQTVLNYIENVYIDGNKNLIDFRFAVQNVLRPDQNFRGFAGQIASGIIRKGDEIITLPSRKTAKVKSLITFDGELEQGFSGQSVVMELDQEIDISRGDMVCRPNNIPRSSTEIEAMIIWMDEEKLVEGKNYLIKHTTRNVRAKIIKIRYKVDVNTLRQKEADTLDANDIGRVSLVTTSPLYLDSYKKNRQTGSFIIIDPSSNRSIAAALIVDRTPDKKSINNSANKSNLTQDHSLINFDQRTAKLKRPPQTLWLTGLSGSGKSTISRELEKSLFEMDIPTFRLDGDNIRLGLSQDLGFCHTDRKENIRRVAEVAKLLNQSGQTAIVAFISPFEKDRELAKNIIGEDSFVEVYISTPLETCEHRDPKGLYKKARANEIEEFTGISSPYEPPLKPEINIDSTNRSIEACVDIILNHVTGGESICRNI
jgi:bifunctional enzyme CysN/CysC